MTVHDFLTKTRQRYQDNTVGRATYYTASDAVFGLQRKVSPDFGLGQPVWEKDWDILVVLDACRVDLFQQACHHRDWLPPANSVESMWSLGTASPEWIGRTFNRRQYGEEMASTAYLTLNPFSSKPGERAEGAPGHALPLHDSDFAMLDEVWKQQASTSDPIERWEPRQLTDRAIRAWRDRDELGVDRMVVHYMQPHIPFRSRPEWFDSRENLNVFGEPGRENRKDAWKKVRDGEIDRGEFWTAYLDNLEWVLDDVELLRENATGEIALSADHGNAVGEYGSWGHKVGTVIPEVRRVPWVVVSGRDSGAYTPNVVGEDSAEGVGVDEQLASLGYR